MKTRSSWVELGLVMVLAVGGTSLGQDDAPPPPPQKAKKVARAAVDAELEKVKNPDEEIRLAALEKLRTMDPSAARWVAKALRDDDNVFRLQVARLIGDYRNPDVVPEITKQLRREKEVNVRRALAQSLGKIGGPVIFEPLSDHLDDEREVPVLRDCLLALGKCQNPHAVDVILDFAEEREDPYLEQIACFALRELTRNSLDTEIKVWRDWWKVNREGTLESYEKKRAEEARKKEESENEEFANQ